MSSTAIETVPKNDFVGTVLAVTLVLAVAAYTATYELLPVLRSVLAFLIAGLSLGLAYTASLTNIRKALPLLMALCIVGGITLMLEWAEIPQDFNVLLRYLTAIAGIFSIHMTRLPNLTRLMAYVSMAIVAYAGYVAATGGSFAYAGTIRAFPFWSGLANSSFLVAALLIVIALSSVKPFLKVPWLVLGAVVLAGYGAVTAVLMVALFFTGWYFLFRGWNRTWLYIFVAVAVVGGVFFRNANSVAGADIDSLGVGAVGSGRLDSWFGRFAEFLERDLATKLFGLGPYSDYQISGLWYWAEKNAHSDIVTILMEFGVLGLTAILFLWISTFRRVNGLAQVALLAIAMGAASSNTFIDRPAVAVVWGFVLFACGFHEVKRRKPGQTAAKEPPCPKFRPAYERIYDKASRAP